MAGMAATANYQIILGNYYFAMHRSALLHVGNWLQPRPVGPMRSGAVSWKPATE